MASDNQPNYDRRHHYQGVLAVWVPLTLSHTHNIRPYRPCSWWVFWTALSVCTKLMNVIFGWSANNLANWRCPWCNGYRRRKWTRRHEFKSWTRQIAFHIALIPLRKVWIQLFSLQRWVNSRAGWVLQPW